MPVRAGVADEVQLREVVVTLEADEVQGQGVKEGRRARCVEGDVRGCLEAEPAKEAVPPRPFHWRRQGSGGA